MLFYENVETGTLVTVKAQRFQRVERNIKDMECANDFFENVEESMNQIPIRIWNHNLKGAENYTYLHWHRAVEITLNIKGKARFNVSGKNFILSEREMCIINSSEVHQVEGVSKDDYFLAVTIIISYDFIRQWENSSYTELWFRRPDDKEIEEKMANLIEELSILHEEEKDYKEVMIMAKGSELVYYLLKFCRMERSVKFKSRTDREVDKIKQVLGIMEKEYQNQISLEIMAEQIHFTPSYFSKFFKRCTGYNFYNYLQKIRLIHALQDLQKTEKTILECAMDNGFANVKSFIKIVKEEYGYTPNEYKKYLRSEEECKNDDEQAHKITGIC